MNVSGFDEMSGFVVWVSKVYLSMSEVSQIPQTRQQEATTTCYKNYEYGTYDTH